MSQATALTPLVNAASAYYRTAGRFALHFARAKLARDPAFALILAQGLLAGRYAPARSGLRAGAARGVAAGRARLPCARGSRRLAARAGRPRR